MTRANIDLYPGDLCIEDVPADFTTETSPPDMAVGDHGGIWATLDCVKIGGLTLTRDQVLLMIGCKALVGIEAQVSEGMSWTGPFGARFDLAAE